MSKSGPTCRKRALWCPLTAVCATFLMFANRFLTKLYSQKASDHLQVSTRGLQGCGGRRHRYRMERVQGDRLGGCLCRNEQACFRLRRATPRGCRKAYEDRIQGLSPFFILLISDIDSWMCLGHHYWQAFICCLNIEFLVSLRVDTHPFRILLVPPNRLSAPLNLYWNQFPPSFSSRSFVTIKSIF